MSQIVPRGIARRGIVGILDRDLGRPIAECRAAVKPAFAMGGVHVTNRRPHHVRQRGRCSVRHFARNPSTMLISRIFPDFDLRATRAKKLGPETSGEGTRAKARWVIEPPPHSDLTARPAG